MICRQCHILRNPAPHFLSDKNKREKGLTVRLLVTGTGTTTTELLRLCAAVVGNQKRAVVLDESLLELVLGVLVDVLLVVGDDGLGDGLANGVDLRGVTTTGDADTDVDTGELVDADDQEGLVDLWTSRQIFCWVGSFAWDMFVP